MSLEPPVTVSVTRRYVAQPERVFDAWLDPAMLDKWMFGPAVREEEIVRLTVDAKVGGAFSFVVRRQGNEINHVGVYRQIDRPRRLAFTWGIAGDSEDESVVKINIVPLEAECVLTLTHEMDPKWKEYASRTEAAWAKMLDSLAKALSSESTQEGRIAFANKAK